MSFGFFRDECMTCTQVHRWQTQAYADHEGLAEYTVSGFAIALMEGACEGCEAMYAETLAHYSTDTPKLPLD